MIVKEIYFIINSCIFTCIATGAAVDSAISVSEASIAFLTPGKPSSLHTSRGQLVDCTLEDKHTHKSTALIGFTIVIIQYVNCN